MKISLTFRILNGIILLTSLELSRCVIAQNTTPPSIPPAQWDRDQQAVEGQNVPITFYGKIVDQSGHPLGGANILLRVQEVRFSATYFALPKYHRFERTTDPDGLFFLNGISGRGLDIESIKKQGYEFEKDINPVYGPVAGSLEKPVTLVLFKKGYKSPLLTGKENFTFVPDGRFYSINLTNHTISDATNSQGSFIFRVTRKRQVGKWDRFDWTFDLMGENGNTFKRANEPYDAMLFAPATDFTNSYECVRHASDDGWRSVCREQFYLKLENSCYGKLSLLLDAAAGNSKTSDGGILIRYTINPTVSPMLR